MKDKGDLCPLSKKTVAAPRFVLMALHKGGEAK